jgi:hypothetical protein
VLLAVFIVPHLGIRYWGVSAGLKRGREIARVLEARPLSRVMPGLALAITFLAAATAGALATPGAWSVVPGGGALAAAGSLLVFLALVTLQVRGVAPGRLLLGACVAAVLAAGARMGLAP